MMANGLEMREAHFPDCAPIEAYGNGGFRFANLSHQGSILCLSSGIYGLKDVDHGLVASALEPFLPELQQVDFFLIGTGKILAPLEENLAKQLKTWMISFELMSTGAAVRTYNVLLSEERKMAAFFRAVD